MSMPADAAQQDWNDPLFRRLLDAMPDAILVVDDEGVIRQANPRVFDVFGYQPPELVGQPIELLVPQARRAQHVRHRKEFGHHPQARPMGSGLELVALHRSGHSFPTEVALSPMQLGSRSVTLASARDVSASVRARQAEILARYSAYVAELGEYALSCESSEPLFERLQLIGSRAFEDAAVVLFRRSERSGSRPMAPLRVLPATSPAGSPAGAAAGAAATAPGAGTLQLPEAIDDPSIAYTQREHGALLIEDFANERRFAVGSWVQREGLRSGLNVPVMLNDTVRAVLAVRSRTPRRFNDQDTSFLMSLSNIVATALHRLDSQSQVAHLQRLESLGQLTGGIAHDFNNLLAIISGNLQILEEDAGAQPASAIASARHAVDRGAALTGKLLAFARRQPLRAATLDVRKVVAGLVQLLQRTLGSSITLQASVTGEALYCRADAGQLENALINLALNARDAMPQGGTLEISGSLADIGAEAAGRESELQPGRYVVLSVTDTGQGIADEHLPHIFEPFFTTKGAGKGTGLGLSMVYGFARQSGGHVALHSEVGRGTQVRVLLPAVEAPAMQVAADPAMPPVAANASWWSRTTRTFALWRCTFCAGSAIPCTSAPAPMPH